MKIKKQILGVVLFITVLFTACTQQYDSENDFEYVIIDDEEDDKYARPDETPIYGIYITGYRGTKQEVRIPPRIKGKPVVVIEENAFNGKGLTNVTIPNSVLVIGYRAFANNQLASINIPNKVFRLEGFSNNQLISVTIPESVIEIGNEAFSNNQLTSVIIGNNVKYISRGAFANNQLTSVIIPESLIYIEGNAFTNNQLNSINIGSNIELYGESVFPNAFDHFYRLFGNKAGTYTLTAPELNAWTVEFRD